MSILKKITTILFILCITGVSNAYQYLDANLFEFETNLFTLYPPWLLLFLCFYFFYLLFLHSIWYILLRIHSEMVR